MGNQQPSIEWRIIEEQPKYEVNNLGQVRHIIRKQILKPRLNKGGYNYFCVCNNGKRINYAVHRAVAIAFIPNPDNKTEINHINSIRDDNRLENLEWVTSSENKHHAYLKAENSISRGKKIHQYTLDNEYIKTYDTVRLAAEDMGCSIGAISNCASGRTKTSQGYIWKFDEGSTTRYNRTS